MKLSTRVRRFLFALLGTALALLVFLAVYTGSIPEKFRLQPGDSSPFDIIAPRSIEDRAATDLRAAKASAAVEDVMLRSEQTAKEVKAKVARFFEIVTDQRRSSLQPTAAPTPQPTSALPDPATLAESIALELNQKLGIVITSDDALRYASHTDNRYASIRGHVETIASLIMAETVDNAGLKSQLSDKIADLQENLNYYQEDIGIIERTLSLLLEPNVVFDEVATENARQAAYDEVQGNPDMIDKGTRIVSIGDIITDDTYTMLQDLSLIDSGRFDFLFFAGIVLMLVLLFFLAGYYISRYEKDAIHTVADFSALILTLLIPLLVSVYISRDAPLASPVYFAAVLLTAYFGLRTSLVLTLCLTAAILPMTRFEPVFLIVAMCGSMVASLFTKGIIRKGNFAFIIISTAGANFIMTLSYGLLQKESWSNIMINCGFTSISGALSVIAAIGIMPLFEMMFNSVSPLRLIDLSQPGHPLLRRLFVEAPGSSQHSMMVANLADAAAAAIGANALLARVGAYYHDIGKLENPLMFTENQEGENPHDLLSPEQSAEAILAHPDAGVRIGKRYRLPIPILRIIHEHHGSTAQAYFYHKALKSAEQGARPEPELSQFKYRCPIPSSRESAIVMLADSVEAAMKSTGTNTLEEAEKLIRKIIKVKNEQDQLISSGLSYHDVEVMVQSFLQVYTGHFHERIKYPDDRTVRQQAN